MSRTWTIFTAIALAAALVSACGGDDEDGDGGPAVAVTLKEWSAAANPNAVAAGQADFEVKNTGSLEHEFYLAKSDEDPARLPTYQASDRIPSGHAAGDVNEEKLDVLGEIEDIEAGSTKSKTFDLKAGKYVIFCNITGHYAQGIRTGFTVN